MSRERSASGREAFGLVNGRILGLIGASEAISERVDCPALVDAARSVALDLESYLQGIADLATTDFESNQPPSRQSPVEEYVETLSEARRHVVTAFQDGDFEFGCLAWGLKQEMAELLEEASAFGRDDP